jgi:hypothetical protein
MILLTIPVRLSFSLPKIYNSSFLPSCEGICILLEEADHETFIVPVKNVTEKTGWSSSTYSYIHKEQKKRKARKED